MATDEQLEKQFKQIDKDHSGSITIDELKKYYLPMQEMLGIAPQLAEQEIIGLMRRLDTDHGGTISLEGKQTELFFSNETRLFFRIQEIHVSTLKSIETSTDICFLFLRKMHLIKIEGMRF